MGRGRVKITLIEYGLIEDRRTLQFEQDIDARYVVMSITSAEGDTVIHRCLLNRDELAALGRAFEQPVAHPLNR